MNTLKKLAIGVAFAAAFAECAAQPKNPPLLNASYDIAREVFAEINPAFQAQWRAKTGQTVIIRQSHGGSSKQARAVAEGLQADVVTLNQVTDIDLLVRAGLIAADWPKRFPHGASPYYSLPVFLVRAGNPKKIRDWDDLVKPGVQVVFPNPKTSGNGRYTYLGAYAYALQKYKGDAAKARTFVAALLANVPVFDTGGRGATTTFVERGIGDVLVTFEAEVSSIRREYAKSSTEMVVPSMSVRADFPVAVVDSVVTRHGTKEVATAYLQFLYSAAAQDILARHFNRVNDPKVAEHYRSQFPPVRLVTVEDAFGGWAEATRVHFADGALLDQLLSAR